MDQKIFSSALSKNKDWRKALGQAADQIAKELEQKSCDLVIFFVSEVYEDFDPAEFSKTLQKRLSARVLIGCNSSGVIGAEREIEMEPAISLIAMHLPGVKMQSFYISAGDADALSSGPEVIGLLDIYPPDKPHFICLADPAGCDIVRFLSVFSDTYKGLPVIGGLASGGMLGKPNWLSLNGAVHTEGVVGVALTGDIVFETIVSQGCRPIGKPYVITKADGNVLYELAGQQTLMALRELMEELPARDKQLAENSLFVGLVMNEHQETFKRGDFLVRNIIGFDPDTGALMVGATLRVGQTLQFQLRDADTSSEDLRVLLDRIKSSSASAPRGGILVSCCGRGKNLFGEPDHDVRMIQSAKGPMPLAGFFASGEIGPIGNKNYVHGYTSSLVILK